MRSMILGGLAVSLWAVTPAMAQFQHPAHAQTGGGGKATNGAGIQHFSATGVGMAVGTAQGGGNTARLGFLVGAAGRSRDEIPPVIEPIPDLVVSTDAAGCEASVDLPAVRVVDARDRAPVVTVTLLTDPPQNIPVGGATVDLPIGSYDVVIVARDRSGNESRASYRVDVEDNTAPVINPVPDPTPVGREIEAQSPAGTPVAVVYGCVDGCDAAPQGSLMPVLARYPVGDTQLTVACEDALGNQVSRPVVVRVRDRTAPQPAQVPAAIRAACQSAQGATIMVPRIVWNDNGTSSELLVQRLVVNPAGANQVLQPIPAELTLTSGQHVLRFIARDAAGNEGQVNVNVEITDNGLPTVRVVSAPPGGWSNAAGEAQVVLELADGCRPDNGQLQFAVAPPADRTVRAGNRVTLGYSREGVYPLAITVRDADNNVTRENSVAFGIDRTPPQPVFRTPGQAGVNPADDRTFPIFARAEILPIDFGGTDGGDGQVSGIRSVQVVFDPARTNRLLAEPTNMPNGSPPRGPAQVVGVGCQNPFVLVGGVQRRDNLCNEDRELDIRYLNPGSYEVEVVVTDFAGNVGRGRARFITADLNAGSQRLIARLNALRPVIGDPLFARLVPAIQNLGRVRDATDERINGSLFNSPRFLGTALRAAQTASIQLQAAQAAMPALPVAGQREVQASIEQLQRFARSDVLLLGDHVAGRPPANQAYVRNAAALDLDFAADFIDEVDAAMAANAWNDAAANTQSAYFHVKSALEGWVMDYHYRPNHAVPLDIQREYDRGLNLLISVAAEMDAYVNEGLAGADTVRDIRRSLTGVINSLQILVDEGFDPDGGGNGLSDQQYVEELIELRSVANRTTLAGQNGVWVRNYQWSMMQVVRFMTQSSVSDAIFTRGGGRVVWPLYVRSNELIEEGVEMLDDRRIQAVIDLYGQDLEAHCLLFAVYHCDFLDDEGDNDLDLPIPVAEIPAECWDLMYRPAEWALEDPVGATPPQCPLGRPGFALSWGGGMSPAPGIPTHDTYA